MTSNYYSGGYHIVDLQGIKLNPNEPTDATATQIRDIYHEIKEALFSKLLLLTNYKTSDSGTNVHHISPLVYGLHSATGGNHVEVSFFVGGSGRYIQALVVSFYENGTSKLYVDNIVAAPKFTSADAGKTLKVNANGNATEWV